MGPLDVCHKHLSVLVTGVLDAMRREASTMIGYGRATPGGIEQQMRFVLAEIGQARRETKHVSEGRPPCVYFAEREGYVKIGTTVNLPNRIRELSAGGSMLQGMTAGPVTVLATIPGGRDKERALHRRFSRQRADRKHEWFWYEGKLREFVEGLQAAAAEHLVEH
jgi:hypothetical protein